ncbi:MAG: GTP cyclohydrolase I FolE [Gammaproteobacteria bacterium]|nr:GTP cyclohydrolase I FolE [Gammaproteobacteria bacterium]NVK88876.1 GTP cyclohydrolase I FolE [Gammaproteobacteria bacterium]
MTTALSGQALNVEPAIKGGEETNAGITEAARVVRDALIKRGLETPLVANPLTRDQKYDRIKAAMADVMDALGLDRRDDSLEETPHRIAKMYVDEIFAGLDYTQFPKITVIDNKMQVEEMVKVKAISVTSTCEHHFVTIDGTAKVAYIPKNKIIGLSKINRLVRFFAQRPQVQERLTQQVLVALQTLLETDDVAVTINATHYCVKARGVMDANSSTETTALGGVFKANSKTRSEFLAS